jgi:hypothetical protein
LGISTYKLEEPSIPKDEEDILIAPILSFVLSTQGNTYCSMDYDLIRSFADLQVDKYTTRTTIYPEWTFIAPVPRSEYEKCFGMLCENLKPISPRKSPQSARI